MPPSATISPSCRAGTNLLIAQQGFKDYYGKAGLQYDFSQRYDLVSSLVGSKYLPDGSPTDTTRYGVEEQFEARPNQVMQWYARLGVDEIHANTLVDGNIDKTLLVGGAGVTWTYQLSQYTADLDSRLVGELPVAPSFSTRSSGVGWSRRSLRGSIP